MPGNTQIKPMKLIFTLTGDIFTRRIEDFDGNLIFQGGNEVYCPIYGTTVFDDYEAQMKQIPAWNITEVVRNI